MTRAMPTGPTKTVGSRSSVIRLHATLDDGGHDDDDRDGIREGQHLEHGEGHRHGRPGERRGDERQRHPEHDDDDDPHGRPHGAVRDEAAREVGGAEHERHRRARAPPWHRGRDAAGSAPRSVTSRTTSSTPSSHRSSRATGARMPSSMSGSLGTTGHGGIIRSAIAAWPVARRGRAVAGDDSGGNPAPTPRHHRETIVKRTTRRPRHRSPRRCPRPRRDPDRRRPAAARHLPARRATPAGRSSRASAPTSAAASSTSARRRAARSTAARSRDAQTERVARRRRHRRPLHGAGHHDGHGRPGLHRRRAQRHRHRSPRPLGLLAGRRAARRAARPG